MKILHCTFLFILLITSPLLNASELHDLLEGAGYQRSGLNQVDLDTLTAMVEFAEKNELTIFETLYDAGTYLKQADVRVSLDGEDLRTLNLRFDLGGDRVNTLLPFDKIINIEIGSSQGKTKPEMEVFLSEKHSDFLEIGDFYLSRHFGFETLEDDWFNDAFGVKVKYLFLKLDLTGLELYDKSKIAIYASSFPKPKRWRIKPIRELN